MPSTLLGRGDRARGIQCRPNGGGPFSGFTWSRGDRVTPILRVSKQTAQEQLAERVAEGNGIEKWLDTMKRSLHKTGEVEKAHRSIETWSARNLETIEAIADAPSWLEKYREAATGVSGAAQGTMSLADLKRSTKRCMNALLTFVKEANTESVNQATMRPAGGPRERIFVVHGHDKGMRDAVALFIENLGPEAVILADEANVGDTVIEKLVRLGNCDFAIVLFSPDDCGGPIGSAPATYRPRARQNVMLELGYFLGRLGRGRVAALGKGDVEIPSDFGGVIWIDFDQNGGWKHTLGKELATANLAVDLSRG